MYVDSETLLSLKDSGKNFNEIAKIMGISPYTVANRYYQFTGKSPKKQKNRIKPIRHKRIRPTEADKKKYQTMYILRKCSCCGKLFTSETADWAYKVALHEPVSKIKAGDYDSSAYNYQCSYKCFREYASTR